MKEIKLYGKHALDLFRYVYALAPKYFQNPKEMQKFYYDLCETNGFEFRKLNNELDEIQIIVPKKHYKHKNMISLNNNKIKTSIMHLNDIPNLSWLIKFDMLSNQKNLRNVPARVGFSEKKLFGWDTGCNMREYSIPHFSEYMQQENISFYVNKIIDDWINLSIINMGDGTLPKQIFNTVEEEFKTKLKELFYQKYPESFQKKPFEFDFVSIRDDNFSFQLGCQYSLESSWHVSLKKEGTIREGKKLTLCEKVMGIRYQ
jgi:hypothetical protein